MPAARKANFPAAMIPQKLRAVAEMTPKQKRLIGLGLSSAASLAVVSAAADPTPAFFVVGVKGTEADARRVGRRHGVRFRHGDFN